MPSRTARRERRPEERPHELLDAALCLFAERGYRATRLEEVAAAAGVTKGAIYHYFGSKEELLVRAVEQRIHSGLSEVERRMETLEAPASTKLRLGLQEMWRRWLEPEWGQIFRILFGDVLWEVPHLFETWAEEGPLRGWALFQRLIEEGQASGEFRADADARVAARLIASGLLFQAALQVHLNLRSLDPCDPDRIFGASIDVLLRGLRAG
jgi:TetR/AcrR family transcriptional regulator